MGWKLTAEEEREITEQSIDVLNSVPFVVGVKPANNLVRCTTNSMKPSRLSKETTAGDREGVTS